MLEIATPGARLLAARTGLRLSQSDMAAELNMNAATISRHEHSKAALSPQVALRYATFFGIDVDYLLCHDIARSAAQTPLPPTSDAPATTPGSRLKALRISRGFTKLMPTARLIGVKPVTMNHHEMGLREITPRRAAIYAAFYRVPASYILFGETLPVDKYVDIVGTIEAGGRVAMMSLGGSDVQRIALPGDQALDLVAYVVLGEGLYPAYFHGDVVLTPKPNGHVDPLEVNNRECIVETASGERLIRLVKAESNGRFTIFGPHSPPQMHIRLRHAVPVVQINRGQLRAIPQHKPG
jgi:transcriptional regulator with XRE-family HTH domain